MPKYISRICNNSLTRHSRTEFNMKWDYSGALVWTDSIAWQYHTNAMNVKNGNQEVKFHSPDHQVIDTGIDTKSLGPNFAIPPNWFWPNKYPSRGGYGTPGGYWVVVSTLIDMYIRNGGVNREQLPTVFEFYRPLPPGLEIAREQNVLTWTITADPTNEMGTSSHYDCSRTRYYFQRIEKGQSYPRIPDYDTGNGFHWFNPPGQKKDTFVWDDEITIAPEVPVKLRVVAINDGFAGETRRDQWAIKEHTFARPRTPTIVEVDNGGWSIDSTTTSGQAQIHIKSNSDGNWYPVDQLIVERQVASKCSTSQGASWQKVGNEPYKNQEGIKSVAVVPDGYLERLPDEDKATWYRVTAWHDDENNKAVSEIIPAPYVNRPKKPTITATFEQDTRVKMNVTVNSEMNIKTFLGVKNLTKDDLGDDVPPYELTSGEQEFYIQKGGQPMFFSPNCVYEISVYNQVTNEGLNYGLYGTMADGSLPMSEVATTLVRGSAGAIAKAMLSTPEITSLTLNPSGKGVTVGWNIGEETYEVEYDEKGTYIEWTNADGGWISTTKPNSHKVPDDGGNKGLVSIDGLEEGKTYQIRLRRYVSLNGEDGFGSEATTSAVPWSTPGKPTLTAPGYVLPGESVFYTWTFEDEGDTPQNAAVLTINGEALPIEGSAGSYLLEVPTSMEGETLEATISVACNGGFSEPSDPVVTTVAEKPTCTIELTGNVDDTKGYMGNTLTALPLTVNVGGTGDTFKVRAVSNGGARAPEPDGGREIAAGEVAATEVFFGSGEHEIDGTNIIGGGNYELICTCVDTTTGMESDPVSVGFSVDWATRATMPTGNVVLSDEKAYITPVQGDGAPLTESCRIWRKTADGYAIACANAIWGKRHIDPVPAYGGDELAYVVEAISVDGDHKWAELPYTLDGDYVTINYGEQSVKLAWDLQPKSTYKKGFERRSHMDGHRAGYWEPGVDRDWSSGADFMKGEQPTDVLREIARYDGLCYVRAPFGVAFAANVDIDLSCGYDSAFTSASMSCAEVEDDGTYAIVVEPSADDETPDPSDYMDGE